MSSAQGARDQPLFIEISTANEYDVESFGWNRYQHCRQVLDGEIKDPTHLVQIFESDKDDAWDDEEVWPKANPNLGVSVNIDAGGAKFQLNTKASTRIDVGITSLTSAELGNNTVGRLNSLKTGGTNSIDSGNFNQARKIVAAGTGLIAYERGRLGAISKYAVTSTLNAMAAAKTQITSAISNIEDVDMVAETANNKRLQTLMTINAALMSAMTTNANSVLKLLLNL